MFDQKALLDKFHSFTSVLKDIGWWLAAGIAVGSFLIKYPDNPWINIGAHTAASILLCYVVIRAIVYRRRNRRLYKCFIYVHKLVHELRDHLGLERSAAASRQTQTPAAASAADEKIEQNGRATIEQSSLQTLQLVLQKILDNSAFCFRELTGLPCTSVLLMPQRDEKLGDVFASRLYSSDAPNLRVKESKPHRSGLVPMAFQSNEVLCFPNLEDEMRKGNYDRRGLDEPFKWYKSSMMCHFKVGAERWGVLSIDSPTPNAFKIYYGQILCPFADALGLAFELSLHGTLGHYVTDQK